MSDVALFKLFGNVVVYGLIASFAIPVAYAFIKHKVWR